MKAQFEPFFANNKGSHSRGTSFYHKFSVTAWKGNRQHYLRLLLLLLYFKHPCRDLLHICWCIKVNMLEGVIGLKMGQSLCLCVFKMSNEISPSLDHLAKYCGPSWTLFTSPLREETSSTGDETCNLRECRVISRYSSVVRQCEVSIVLFSFFIYITNI